MPAYSPNLFEFFLFILPGFVAVWSFRQTTKTKSSGEFEYIMSSVFWGLVIFIGYSYVAPSSAAQFLKVPYGAALLLSLVGYAGGYAAGNLVKKKL